MNDEEQATLAAVQPLPPARLMLAEIKTLVAQLDAAYPSDLDAAYHHAVAIEAKARSIGLRLNYTEDVAPDRRKD